MEDGGFQCLNYLETAMEDGGFQLSNMIWEHYEEIHTSLVESTEYKDQPEPLRPKTGTVWTAIAHIITGVIGAGVLSLAWSIAQLGWVAGPVALIAFAAITLVSTFLLCDCYRSPDPEVGSTVNRSYLQAIRHYLGRRNESICGVLAQESLYGTGIAYTITAAVSMRDVDVSVAYLLAYPIATHPHDVLNRGINAAYATTGMDKTKSLEIYSTSSIDDDGRKRTGTLWTCVAHIITAVIGSGVLSLAWSTAQLGWIAGPLCLICFAFVTYLSASLLSDCYRSPHPVTGLRNSSYMDAVKRILGRKYTWFCGSLQYLSLYGSAVAYVITTSTSIRAIQKSNCYHKEGHQASCSYGDDMYMLLFGCVQIIMSQIPDFHNMEWLSVLAALMSFAYATIGLSLGFAKVIGNQAIKGSISGVPASSTLKKLSLVFQALGDIAFAYPYAIIVLEIQDTLKAPPAENQTMKKASLASVLITTFFYLFCGCFGYAAFGNDTPGNILTGFGFYEPYWLIDFANACIVVHLVGGYQVYSQPVFAFVERWLAELCPNSRFVHDSYTIKLPLLPSFSLNLLRLCFRTAYVASTTGIAMLFPYFNQVLGLLGALNFWPLAIYFPVEMYIVQRKINVWTIEGILLRTFSAICLLVSIVAFAGSVAGVVIAKLA